MSVTETAPEETEDAEKRVAPLELFFDLVFVFALTQVTTLMAENPTWEGLGQGMLVLAALWWAWGAYAWLTNYVAAEEGTERLLMFAVMGAFLVAALATPRRSAHDALLFGVAYAIARWLHIFIFAEANDERRRRARRSPAVPRTALPAPLLLIVAGVHRRHAAGRDLDRRAGDRLLRPVRVRRARLPRVPRPLRRALLADRDHRAGRVDRGDRRRASAATSTAGIVAARCSAWCSPARSGGRTST